MFILVGLVGFIVVVYAIFQWKIQYWNRRGVPGPSDAAFPLGNDFLFTKPVILRQRNMGYVIEDQYSQFKHLSYYGVYGPFGAPTLVINDPNLLKLILVKDSRHFLDRFGDLNPYGGDSDVFTDKIWQKQLLFLQGDLWKDVRSTFSPIFSSSKIKFMMHFMKAIGIRLKGEIQKAVDSQQPIDTKDVFSKFSMDTIATCAFGVDAGSFEEDNSEFLQHARKIFINSALDNLKMVASFTPGLNFLLKSLRMKFFKPKETLFMYNVITATIKHRIESQTRKNDLIDLMIDAINETNPENIEDIHSQEQYEIDSNLEHKAQKDKLDELIIVSTALIIMAAGYDTTSMTLTYCAYELAQHPEVQEKVLQEIDEVMVNLEDGQDFPDYNILQGMRYLDAVIHETLRFHTPVPVARRICLQDYTPPGYDLTIEKGTYISVPIYAIHRDAQYYPDPEEFNPDNFTAEGKKSRSPYSFLAFGQGPRSCIGMRFALMEAKVGLFSVLMRYRFSACPQTPKAIIRAPDSVLGIPAETLWLAVQER
uniref:Cytochrome P450 CYP3026B2 n=1 Tax=Tigriopus kingsejongensis TaxID=1133412 RepID=A0A2H4FY85_9MAXI|nr:cytochrome P450 CYP3026B2 [Tigriopus kingsejongensis]